jgi:hypothetical protein
MFVGVSCTDATDCTAVGYDGNGQPMYATETEGAWGTPTEIPGSAGGYGFVEGVSCTDATDCTAVGYDGNDQPMYATETGGVWGAPTEVPGSSDGTGYFNGVSCTSATDCTAVGYDDESNPQPIYATETGGTWDTVTEIPGTFGGSAFLSGVSCTDATDCTAVGSDGNGQPIYVTDSGGSWGTVTEVPDSTDSGTFEGVSCTDATDCTAVGSDGNEQPIYVTESGGTWGNGTEVPSSAGRGSFQSVSCTDATDCTAVGAVQHVVSEHPLRENEAPFYVTESGGTWGTATEIPSSPSGSGQFDGVSCTDATDCTAIGSDGNGQPVYAASTGSISITTTVDDSSTNEAWSGNETAGASAFDTSIVSGEVDNIAPTGTVSYNLFLNDNCTGSPTQTWTVNVGAPSGDTASLSAGNDSFQATYSGDSNYEGSTSACESFVVRPTVSIATNPLTVNEDQSASDQANGNGGGSAISFSETGAPGSMTINPSTGLLTGNTGSVSGQFSVTITAVAGGVSNSLILTLYVVPTNVLHITTKSLPSSQKEVRYSATLTALGGSPPYRWKIISGRLPAGLALRKRTGTITGAPSSSATTETFTVRVKDHSHPKQTAQVSFTITIT